MNFETIKRNFNRGLWNKVMVRTNRLNHIWDILLHIKQLRM